MTNTDQNENGKSVRHSGVSLSMNTYMIPVDKLRIPAEYQRAIDWTRVRRMVRSFDIELFTPLEVTLREDGYYYIMDGQHHFCVGKIMGATEMPCFIRKKSGVSEEAAFFRVKNSCQSKPTPKANFKAGLAQGDPQIVELQRVFNCLHVQISERRGPQRVTAIGEVMRLVNTYGVDTVGSAFMLSVNAWPDDPANCSSDLIAGLSEFVCRYGNSMPINRFYNRFADRKLPAMLKKYEQVTIAQNMDNHCTTPFKRRLLCNLLVDQYNSNLKHSARLEK
ncbi:hypothetical protein AGMMS49992_11790 [Clostridia bacterium]|nr:hypothetical protein AGMMS49992_11790 [Clostridia bacterium]